MSTIQLSPQLHHAVKWAKVHATEDGVNGIQPISSSITPLEIKALLNTLKESKGKVKREELNTYWV